MNYLAIDASTEACSVALSYQGKVINRFELCPQSHSVVLLPMIDDVLKEANCKLQDLDGLIFGRGPGSFTGVRIGIGVAQGLAFSAELKVVGVSTLQAMAQQAFRRFQEQEVISAIDARMSEVYTGNYRLDENEIMQEVLAEAVISPESISQYYDTRTSGFYGVGTGWGAYTEQLNLTPTNTDIEILYPDAVDMLTIGTQLFAKGEGVDAENAQPVYVRDTVSWKKLPGRE